MDRFERIQELRDRYESKLDEAERLRDEYHRAIVKLHRSGASLREIAEGLGISHQRVHQIVSPPEERKAPRSKRRAAAGGLAGVILLVGVASFVLLHADQPSRVSGGAPSPMGSTSSPSTTIARYFFSASGIGGVLEVSSSPASICYETQSYPARPISIVTGPSSQVLPHAEVSYAPDNNNFCDRTVKPTLAAALLADPSGYQVRWRPQPNGPTAFSSFAPE